MMNPESYNVNPKNVYSGASSIKDYYNPDKTPPLPLVELPPELNPFLADNVHIYAKMMTMLPAHNVKELPALAMLSKDMPKDTRTVVEYSSGSTVISMAMINRILHGVEDTKAFISNKTSAAKLRMLQVFGLDVQLFGGPSQPEPDDDRGGIQRARRIAQESDSRRRIVNPNQYENEENWNAHRKWTGPQILMQLPETTVVCCGMGTAGTMTGIGSYMKENKPSVTRIGVCTAPGDRVPGPRSFALLRPVTFPWKDAVDHIVEANSEESFTASLRLTRNGIVCGPSSGFSLCGLLKFLSMRQANGDLDSLRDEFGQINCVFICCDLPYQYIDEYFHKVSADEFHPVKDAHLADVDLYRYDEAWELHHTDSSTLLHILSDVNAVLLDLRDSVEFAKCQLPCGDKINLPLVSADRDKPSPFYDSHVLEKQWKELVASIGPEATSEIKTKLGGKRVVVLCYSGDTARVATSVLRAASIEAYSIKGGARVLQATSAVSTGEALGFLRPTEDRSICVQ